MLVIHRVEFASVQHGRRCVGATIVVSKRGEFRDSNAACTRNEEYIECYRLLLLLVVSLLFFLASTINTQPPLRFCSDSRELVAMDTTEAAELYELVVNWLSGVSRALR
ncbi:uncharacterized protein LOC143423110 [Xylocopa sonorina]|uniref:uncharacterized protein LOC143423110 n=1 Tax=Xylocopa sonorina TaxID=1818115 RepID=UPI00403A9DAE